MRYLLIGLAMTFLAGCGGGGERRTTEATPAAARHIDAPLGAFAQPAASADGSGNTQARALAASRSLAVVAQDAWGGIAPTAAADQLLDFAERVFGADNPTQSFFPARETSQVLGPFRFRFYAGTSAYLGVAMTPVDGDGLVMGHVYVLGGAFGSTPLDVGALSSFIVPGASNWSWSDVLGTYSQPGSAGGWSRGTISLKDGTASTLLWTNDAGFSWTLTPDYVKAALATGRDNPYVSISGGKYFSLEFASDAVSGFTFLGNVFTRERPGTLASSTGLGSYFNLEFEPSPVAATYAYGFSLYTAIWPAVDAPLDNFQIGYPGTWLNANNDDYPYPLLPADHPFSGSPYDKYSRLFQTIEGSGGYWSSTRFPSTAPKYRINGTPNGYGNQLSSPGWGFGSDALAPGEGGAWALPMGSAGVAQLSNRLLMPPDGWTFRPNTAGEMFGVAWMALPLTDAKSGVTPVGNQSWTVFINATNFHGAAAFYLPDVWTILSRTYPTAHARGLDARPATLSHFAMEYGHMPFFEATDKAGARYLRLPRIAYPTDATATSLLASDFSLYSKAALFQPLLDGLKSGGDLSTRFSPTGRLLPKLKAQPIYMWKGGTDIQMASAQGLDAHVSPAVLEGPGGSSAWTFQWKNASSIGVLPQYFRKEGDYFHPVNAADVPAETGLAAATFASGGRSQSLGAFYTSPATWNSPAPVAGPYSIDLVDGSTVTYSWYRFIDQPSLQGFGWSDAEKAKLQAVVERLHVSWGAKPEFMAPPSFGTLATLDDGLLVTPPKGLEIGYVPIVVRQSR